MDFEAAGKRDRIHAFWEAGHDGTAMERLTGPASHGEKHYGNEARVARLHDAISDPEKPDSSYFPTEADFRMAFCAHVCAKASTLAEYSFEDRPLTLDTDMPRNDADLSAFVIRRDPTTNKLREFVANQTTLVVRTCSADTEFAGMQYVTFYGSMQPRKRQYETGRDLRDDLLLTPYYRGATRLGRAWLEAMADPNVPAVPNRYVQLAGREVLEIQLKGASVLMTTASPGNDVPRIIIHARDDNDYLATSEKGKAIMDAIAKKYPDQYDLVTYIRAAHRKPYAPRMAIGAQEVDAYDQPTTEQEDDLPENP